VDVAAGATTAHPSSSCPRGGVGSTGDTGADGVRVWRGVLAVGDAVAGAIVGVAVGVPFEGVALADGLAVAVAVGVEVGRWEGVAVGVGWKQRSASPERSQATSSSGSTRGEKVSLTVSRARV
jgi:hypothetical protein